MIKIVIKTILMTLTLDRLAFETTAEHHENICPTMKFLRIINH